MSTEMEVSPPPNGGTGGSPEKAPHDPAAGNNPEDPAKLQERGDGGEANGPVKLKRSVGLFSAIGMVAGLIIGSGIFVSPVGVARNVQSVGASLVVWVLGGVMAFIGSICYTELGTMISESGGDYTYVGKGLGRMSQFIYLWTHLVIIQPGNRAVVALTFANYILQPIFPECDAPSHAITILAAFMIILLTIINCVNVDWVTRVQNFFLVCKVIALLMITITGFVVLGMGKTSGLSNAFVGTSTEPLGWAQAIYNSVFTYAGWNYLNVVIEEVKEPKKTLPRAILISVFMVMCLYVFSNLAFFVVLNMEEVTSSTAIAVNFANKMYGPMAWIIPFLVACSTFGGLNSLTYLPSRFYYVGARNQQLPAVLGTINARFLTPIPALLLQLVQTLIVLASGQVYTIISYVTLLETTGIGMSVCSLLYLRYRYPRATREVKVPLFFPIAYLIFVAFLLILTLYSGAESLIGVLIALVSIPVYWIFVLWDRKPEYFQKKIISCTLVIQKICHACPPEVALQSIVKEADITESEKAK